MRKWATFSRGKGAAVLMGMALAGVTLAAYLPACRAGFIIDDTAMIRGNALVKSAGGPRDIWLSSKLPDYYPITSTSLWLESRLWAEAPAGYHLVNILLHSLNAILLWRVLLRLKIPGAWLGGAIFALHPVNVQTVAWIAERKNTLSMAFFAAALLCYLRFDESESEAAALRATTPARVLNPRAWYWIALAAFILSLLSKSAAAPLPLLLLGLAWWRRGRITRRDVLRSLPFFAASAALSLVAIWFQYHRAIGSDVVRTDNFASRLAGAGWAVWFYFYKALLPLHLSFFYPRWTISASNPLNYLPLLLLLAALLTCWRFRQGWGKAWLFCLGYFIVMLLPVLGFINVYFMRYSLVADHWQYFAILGPIGLAAAGLTGAGDAAGKGRTALKTIPGAVLLLGLGALTWRQAAFYRGPDTLWRMTLDQNPKCAVAEVGLGCEALTRNADEAMARFKKAIELEPDLPEAHYNLGLAFFKKHQLDAALLEYQEAIRLQPNDAKAHDSLGNVMLERGQTDPAITQFQAALQIQPDYPEALNNLGTALLRKEQVDAAMSCFQKALALQPDESDAHNNLGTVMLRKGRNDEALDHFRKAVELRPDNVTAQCNLAAELSRRGKSDEAMGHYRKALEIEPDNFEAHNSLGVELCRKGGVQEAISHLQRASDIQPDSAEAQNNLGNALLQSGRADEAIVHYQKAIALKPVFPAARNNLGNALLRSGRKDEALAQFQRAIQDQPDYAEAHRNLGRVLLGKGRPAEAVGHLEKSLESEPDDAATSNDLAWVLATNPEASVRNGPKAIALAQRAERLSGGQNPIILGTLAAAYAEGGRFPEAIAAVRNAIQLANAQSNATLTTILQRHQSLYQAGAPARD